MGNQERYGYDALRITRPVFLDVLRTAISERGIEIKYATKYSHVVQETAEGVTFELVDGTQIKADLLVGADGVHSDVRKHIAPKVQPQYSGNLAILATVNHKFSNPDQQQRKPQTTFFYDKASTILVLPQEHDGAETCLGTLHAYPEQSREDWVHLSYDKEKLHTLFTANSSTWPQRVQNLLTQIDKSDIYIWPFNTLPDLASWTSLPHRRTVLLGDAAHAIPPTGGQGACQAIEDAYTFAMVVSLASRTNLSPDAFARSIDTWQTARQQRIQRARMFTKQLDNNRLPIAERSTLPTGTYWMEGEHPDLSWLYGDGLANSAAKGVTRVEVRKEVGPGPLRIRAATVDSAYGFTRRGTTAVPT